MHVIYGVFVSVLPLKIKFQEENPNIFFLILPQFSASTTYIGDVLSLNNSPFSDYLHLIYQK